MMKHFILTMMASAAATMVLAQSRTVSGVITDAQGNPMPGVAVIVPGTTNGTVTDIDGRYSLSVEGTPFLQATFIGFAPTLIDLSNGQTDIVMAEQEREMDEVVVVAYGTSTKGSYTGSAAQIGSESLERRQVSNVTNALSGTMAGVQTLSSNGQPGSGSTILVRGVGSINAGTDPLIVVDGVPFDGDLSSLNTNDIESMTVLKDAASTALYGARGANGIVMVTTKKGSKGEAKISFEGRWGVNSRQIKNYDVIKDPRQYLETVYQAMYNGYKNHTSESLSDADIRSKVLENIFTGNDGGIGYKVFTAANGSGEAADIFGADGKVNSDVSLGYSDGEYYYTPDDWEDELYKKNMRQSYDLSISGGSDRLDYFFSLGYLADNGIIVNSDIKRLTSRLKVDYQAKKWLNVGANVSFGHTKSKWPTGQDTDGDSSSNSFYQANFIAPIYPLYVRNADGSLLYKNGHLAYDYGMATGSTKSTNFNRTYLTQNNAIAELNYNKYDIASDAFTGNVSALITPIAGLSITAKYGLYACNTRYSNLVNAYFGAASDSKTGGFAGQYAYRTYSLDQQYVANYNRTFGENHNFDLTLGYDGYQYRYTYLGGYGSTLYNPDSYFLSNATSNYSVYGYQNEYKTVGYFARLNYSLKNRYFANVAYRRDASSRFAEDHKWGDFWSASAAWLISGEDFFNVAWVDMLKVKASFGEQGNDAVGNYKAYEDQYEVSGSNGNFNLQLAYKGNKDLTWETTQSFNVGIDFSLFGDVLSGSAEYFARRSKDMLYNKPVAASNGYSSIPVNVGSLTNSGVEIDLKADILRLGVFDWSVNANASFIRNKINELAPELGGKLVNGSTIYEEGKSMYRFNLVEYAGVCQEAFDDQLASSGGTAVKAQPGQSLFWAEDANGNRVKTADWNVAQKTRKATEDLMPKVYGGFGTSAYFFNGIDFSLSFAYQLGGKLWDYGYQSLMHSGKAKQYAGQNWHKDIAKAWTPENTNTDVPRLDANDEYTNYSSTRWLVSSNYLALNNVTVGYSLPENLVGKIGLGTVRIYAAADNVALLTKRQGLDPRQSYTMSTTATYSPIRTISGGIKVTF